jgi:hypothetical protein
MTSQCCQPATSSTERVNSLVAVHIPHLYEYFRNHGFPLLTDYEARLITLGWPFGIQCHDDIPRLYVADI